MAEIDNLSIAITANANNATTALNGLASSLGRVRNTARNTAANLEPVADEMEEVSESTQSAAGSARSFGDRLRSAIAPIQRFRVQLGSAFVISARNAAHAIGNMISGIARIARFRIYRTLVKDLGQSFKDLYGWSNVFGTKFADSMDIITTALTYFRNSIAAMAAPLVNAIAPALDFIIDKAVEALNWFNQLFAVLAGQDTYTAAKKAAMTFGDTIDSSSKKAKKAADDIKRTILGFDEINKLVDNKDKSKSSGTGSSPYSSNFKSMFEERNISGGFKGFSDAIEKSLENTLSRIGLIVSGASLAVGAILAFSGVNVPLGLAMMAAGASGIATIIGLNWNGLSPDVKLAVGAVEAAIGGSLLALGGIMAFSGANIGLGIALMAAGAVSLASGVALNWNLIKGNVSVSAKGVVAALSAASLALGAILAFSGTNVPLGIGLIVSGITGSAVSLNWNYLQTQLSGPLGDVTALISGATLVLGAVAIAAGRIPLGVGLLVTGSFGLTTAIAARWDRLKGYIQGPLADLTTLLSGALLALGFVAIAAGRIPLGVGLMVTGALGITANLAARWDRLKGYMQGPIGDLTALISGAVLMLGVAAIAAGRIPLGLGLLVAGSLGITTNLAARWDRMKSYIEGPLSALTTMISGALLVLGFAAIAAGRIPLGLGMLVTGAIGLTTNLAARWDRLKSYMEGPISALSLILSGASLVLGFTAIAAGMIPLGIGLIVAGAAGLATNYAARWDRLSGYMNGPLGDLTATISAATLVLGFVAIAGGLIPLGIGLIVAGAAGLATNFAARWDRLNEEVAGPLKALTEALTGALLVLGIVALAGGAIPLGIGLLIAGAAGVVSVGSENWQNLVDFGEKAISKVKEGWEKLKTFTVDIVVKIAGKIWDGVTSFWNWIWYGSGRKETLNEAASHDVNLEVNAVKGIGWNTASDPTMWEPAGTQNMSAPLTINLEKGWNGTPQQDLNLDSMKTMCTVTLTADPDQKDNPIKALNLDNLRTTVRVSVANDSSGNKNKKSYKGGSTNWVREEKKLGGIFSNGIWHSIPQFARGTLNAGTIFAAGEAGPEIVGHVGGRTEVLNKSQLASAMYSAVQAAMAPAAANFAAAAQSMGNVNDNGEDMAILVEMVRRGSEATERQNDLLRQQNEYLRSINDKDYSFDVSTSDINRAQTRMNRRAGTAIVSVGT